MRGATHVAAFALLGLFFIAGSTHAVTGLRDRSCARMRKCDWSNAPELSVAIDLVVIALAALVVFTLWANVVFRVLLGPRGTRSAVGSGG